MNNKNSTIFVAAGILFIGLLIVGLIPIQGKSPSPQLGQQDSIKDQDLLMAASISKETLLVLLAVGIAGVLGMSRKKKDIKGDAHRSKPNQPSDP